MLRRGFPVEPANGPGFCEVAWDRMEQGEGKPREQKEPEEEEEEEEEQSVPAVPAMAQSQAQAQVKVEQVRNLISKNGGNSHFNSRYFFKKRHIKFSFQVALGDEGEDDLGTGRV